MIRGYTTDAACYPSVAKTYTDTTVEILVPFSDVTDRCYPNLVKHGIDMADPIATDTPQGDSWFEAWQSYVVNSPSPGAAWNNTTPPQTMIEFDPPVRKIQFYYSRLKNERAMWRGGLTEADSMMVYARSRTPGSLSYWDYDWKLLRSNVPSTQLPYSVWDSVTLRAGGDLIQWLWFDGHLAIDELRIVRSPLVCTPNSVTRGDNVTCKVSEGDVQQWTFVPDPVTIHPKVGPVMMADSVSEASTSPTWEGPLVLSGTVWVDVIIDGQPRRFRARVKANPRSWSVGNSPAGRINVSFGDAWVPYSDVGGGRIHAGENVNVADTTMAPKFTGFDLYSFPIEPSVFSSPIGGGPNRGYVYINQRAITLGRAYRLNRFITEPNPTKDIRYKNADYNRWNALLKQSGRPDPHILFNATDRHEWHGQGAIGHEDGFEQAIGGDLCGNVALRLERIAGRSDLVQLQAEDARQFAQSYLSYAGSHARVHHHIPDPGAPFIMRTQSNPAPILVTVPVDTAEAYPGMSNLPTAECEFERLGIP